MGKGQLSALFPFALCKKPSNIRKPGKNRCFKESMLTWRNW